MASETSGRVSAVLLNVVDLPYDYEDPDHYRISADSDLIPYRI